MRRFTTYAVGVSIVGLFLARPMQARIVRIDIQSTSTPASDGYVTITGRAHGEVDPTHPLNAIIQDIKLASVNVRGMVEYSMDFTIFKPPNGGNGLLFYEVVNRGWPLSRATPGWGTEPLARQRGYTLVWSGWEASLPKLNPLRHTMTVPTASENGKEITGWVWLSVEVTQPVPSTLFWTANRDFHLYEPVDLNAPDSELTRQVGPDDPPVAIPREDWAFARCDAAHPFPGTPSSDSLCVREGMEPRYAYSIRYRAKNPLVMGLGLAAIRDFVSFLRNDSQDSSGAPNPIGGTIKASIMHGASQSGQLARAFLHLGFNQDEQGRQVFEGMNPVIAGTRNPLNVRFSLPALSLPARLGYLRAGWESPFVWMPETDTVAGRFGWLMERCMETASCPLIIDVVGSAEYWNQRASLKTTDTSGQFDAWIPRNVRMYLVAGTQHSPAPFPPNADICQQLTNPNDWFPYSRALTVALEQWVLEGKEPPPSQIPTLAEGTLVQPDAPHIGWPKIPGVNYTGRINALPLVDFGPAFNAKDMTGILAEKPVVIPDREYAVLVPKVDADGNEIAGIRPAALQAPIATYTGWNLQRAGFAEGQLCQNSGSYIPFRRSKAERDAAGDPRLSLEERYGNHAGYVDAVRQAANRQVAERYLLPEDAKTIVDRAEKSDVLQPVSSVEAFSGPSAR